MNVMVYHIFCITADEEFLTKKGFELGTTYLALMKQFIACLRPLGYLDC